MKASGRLGVSAERGAKRAARAGAALAVVLPAAIAFSACGGTQPPKTAARSFHAESCSIDDPASDYEPQPPFGLFDTGYTEYTRKRAPPGHSCCYSWCDKVKLADASSPSIREACRTATAC